MRMDRFTNIYCQNMIDELNEYPTLDPANHDIRHCYEAIQSRNARIAELEQRWVPVSERLPELHGEIASDYIDVAYRYAGGVHYMRRNIQYWKDYGWIYEFKFGKPVTFFDCGYVIDYWMPLYPLPETLPEPLEPSW
jgi:hypothetical protein